MCMSRPPLFASAGLASEAFFFFFLLIQLGLTFWGTRGEHLAMLRDSFLWGAWCPGEHVCLGLNPEPLESFSTLGFGLAFPLKETS